MLAPAAGVLIAESRLPLVNEGEALFHVATFDRPARVAKHVEEFRAEHEPDEDWVDGDDGGSVNG